MNSNCFFEKKERQNSTLISYFYNIVMSPLTKT